MTMNVRKFILVFTTACFILSAVGVMLALHLAEHKHDPNHNPATCPICQQAMINKGSAILQPPPKICQVNEISFNISYRNFFLPQIIEFQFPPLRAPPTIS
jgi:hypothetical protein